jgi:hypothetical protein
MTHRTQRQRIILRFAGRTADGIQREPASATAAGRPVTAVTGREAARAEMRRLAQRAAERRAEQTARDTARREAAVRAVRRPRPAE